jgi:hypothetical protein
MVVAADRLLKWRLPAFIWAAPGNRSDLVEAVANASGNLTAYLALLAGAISIIFTYHQLRAKVRADNRQAWIDKARRLLAQIIADADAGRSSAKAISRRLELKLMLNPKEKDHRILTFLLQRLARVQDQEQIEPGQHLRRVVGEELARSPKHHRYQHLLNLFDEGDRGTLVSYVVRLSHVLLKREWERVKHTR